MRTLAPADIWWVLKHRFGSYHRWHKLYIQYSVCTVGEVDVTELRKKLVWLAMLDGRRLFDGIDEDAITQMRHYGEMEEWALWRTFLVLLRRDERAMRSVTVLRLLAITSVLQKRRREDVQKGRSPYLGIYWEESDLRR